MSTSYDEKQYESYSYSLTSPAHLQTVGKLFGLNTKDYKQSRVLEMGCASGGNIIPLAANFPKMEFVGIDLSEKQVEEGKKMIKALGLKNIKLKALSITDIKEKGKFDYIICHGVYAWVGEEVRKSILSKTKKYLADDGIACISYNTMPAWNMVLTVRDMMKFHVRNFQTPEEQVQQARVLLNFISSGLEKEQSPYAKFLKDELTIISAADDSYIYHEYLEEINNPIYFHEFVEQCREFDLGYLSDSHIPSMFPGNLKQSFSEKLSEIKDVVRMGQYMDFIRNQRFRTTLVCNAGVTVDRNLDVNVIEKYHLSYCGQFQGSIDLEKVKTNETLSFQSRGVVLTVQNPIVKACMKILHDRFGKPIAFEDLVQESMDMVGHEDKETAKATLIQELNLMRLYLGGLIQIHLDEGIYTHLIDQKPKTTKHIQIVSKDKAKVPNLRHETHQLQDIERILLQFLDGNTTLSDLNEILVDKIKSKELNINDDNGQPIVDEDVIRERVKQISLATLENLVKKAYLIQQAS